MIFEKIRERLQELHNEACFPCDFVSESQGKVYNYFESKLKEILKLMDEYNNGWIPCEVELPKIATSYLVAEEVIVNSKKLYVVDIRLFGTEDEWLCPSNRKIIAWQPLPQPPKGE